MVDGASEDADQRPDQNFRKLVIPAERSEAA
jgi:hypothetical protein